MPRKELRQYQVLCRLSGCLNYRVKVLTFQSEMQSRSLRRTFGRLQADSEASGCGKHPLPGISHRPRDTSDISK